MLKVFVSHVNRRIRIVRSWRPAKLVEIGRAEDHALVGPEALGWAVAGFGRIARLRPIELDEDGVGDPTAEGPFHGLQVRLVAVRGQLHAVGQSRGQIGDEVARLHRIARPDQPAWDKLRLGADGRPRPHFVESEDALPLGRDVFLLGKAE